MAAPVRSVMVIGYGTMGKGVLASFAAHGFATIIVSRAPEKLDDLPEGTVAAGPELPTLEAPPDLIGKTPPPHPQLQLLLSTSGNCASGRHTAAPTVVGWLCAGWSPRQLQWRTCLKIWR
jgi:hypothetical protein